MLQRGQTGLRFLGSISSELSSAFDIEQVGFLLHRAEREVDDRGEREERSPVRIELDLSFGEEIAEELHRAQARDHREVARVFSAEDGPHGEVHVGSGPAGEFGEELGDALQVVDVDITELLGKEAFFGGDDAFVVQPEREDEDETRGPGLCEHHDAEHHEEVADIQRVPADGVDAGGVEGVGDLGAGVASGGSRWDEPDGQRADDEAEDRDEQAGELESIMKDRVVEMVVVVGECWKKDKDECEGEIAAPAEKELAGG